MTASVGVTLFSCAVLGFRHGFDYDHIAAITDLASLQRRPAAAMRLGLLYALGHAAMVAVLGTVVIVFQLSLPRELDSWAERLVGVTLIALAIYVLCSLLCGEAQALPPSRAALILRGWRRLRRAWPGSAGAGAVEAKDAGYTGRAAFVIGVIHGVGAETPSQLALFLLAANLGGVGRGIWGMALFLAGLLVMNTLMSASASGVFRRFAPHPRAMQVVVGVTAVYSLVVGCMFVLGGARLLPGAGLSGRPQ